MKIHFWNTIFALLFIFIFALFMQILFNAGRLPLYIRPFDMILIVLATYRLTRLFTYDVITKFIRDWFEPHSSDTFLGTLGVLINCPWCTGLWFALLVSFLYALSPVFWFVIFVFAVAGVASFFQILTRKI